MNGVNFAKVLLVLIALSGASSVLLGAWLAHAGQQLILADKARLVTAHHYQIIHTLAALASILSYRVKLSRVLLISSLLFIVGILTFSGSLYMKTYTGIDDLGKLAPFGGVILALAWILLAFVSIGTKEK
ncbi:DUF423 domain-containing protein [Thalassotalea sp. G2M2-11]|uniref:DUF423 domain-containing protein n=1 Tax=Thalassotalea sp. G2M2-11 TaxID=2787627 RepID=UPI0019D240D6|nr:DUF423 domain-containing protein [Thalassotalea sp. G2M2-11]